MYFVTNTDWTRIVFDTMIIACCDCANCALSRQQPPSPSHHYNEWLQLKGCGVKTAAMMMRALPTSSSSGTAWRSDSGNNASATAATAATRRLCRCHCWLCCAACRCLTRCRRCTWFGCQRYQWCQRIFAILRATIYVVWNMGIFSTKQFQSTIRGARLT